MYKFLDGALCSVLYYFFFFFLEPSELIMKYGIANTTSSDCSEYLKYSY